MYNSFFFLNKTHLCKQKNSKEKKREELLAMSGFGSARKLLASKVGIWKQWSDIFGRFLMRQKSVSSELVMIDDVRQQLSRFGVEKGKIEVPVCYGGARERERERERER